MDISVPAMHFFNIMGFLKAAMKFMLIQKVHIEVQTPDLTSRSIFDNGGT